MYEIYEFLPLYCGQNSPQSIKLLYSVCKLYNLLEVQIMCFYKNVQRLINTNFQQSYAHLLVKGKTELLVNKRN
jgi:hypothetical protein